MDKQAATLPRRVRVLEHPFEQRRVVCVDTRKSAAAHEAAKAAHTEAGKRMFAYASGLGMWVAYACTQEALAQAVRIALLAEREPSEQVSTSVKALDVEAALAAAQA